jgi:hypothetical protein
MLKYLCFRLFDILYFSLTFHWGLQQSKLQTFLSFFAGIKLKVEFLIFSQ